MQTHVERPEQLRIVVRELLARDRLVRGYQTRLAELFHVSRQRVHQVVKQEQRPPENRGV